MDQKIIEEFFAALKKGTIEDIIKDIDTLLERYPGLATTLNSDGKTPLYFYITSNNFRNYIYDIDGIIKRLIKNGADVNQPNRDGLTPIWAAIFQGERYLLEKFLSAEYKLNIDLPFKKSTKKYLLCSDTKKNYVAHIEMIFILAANGVNQVELKNIAIQIIEKLTAEQSEFSNHLKDLKKITDNELIIQLNRKDISKDERSQIIKQYLEEKLYELEQDYQELEAFKEFYQIAQPNSSQAIKSKNETLDLLSKVEIKNPYSQTIINRVIQLRDAGKTSKDNFSPTKNNFKTHTDSVIERRAFGEKNPTPLSR